MFVKITVLTGYDVNLPMFAYIIIKNLLNILSRVFVACAWSGQTEILRPFY